MILNEETATWFTMQTAAVPSAGEFHLTNDEGTTLCGRELELTNEEFTLQPLCAVCNGLSTPEDMTYTISRIAEFFREQLQEYVNRPVCNECGEKVLDGEPYTQDEQTGEVIGHTECLEGRGIAGDRRDDSGYWKEQD